MKPLTLAALFVLAFAGTGAARGIPQAPDDTPLWTPGPVSPDLADKVAKTLIAVSSIAYVTLCTLW